LALFANETPIFGSLWDCITIYTWLISFGIILKIG